MQRNPAFQWDVVAGDFRNDFDNPKREKQSNTAGNHADCGAFEHKEPHDTAAVATERHSHRDFATSSGEANEQKIRNVAARNQQNRADGDEQRHESRPQIVGYIFVRAHED